MRPFLVGGCCAELPGALAGARDALGRVGLAYLDGHLDLYDGVDLPDRRGRRHAGRGGARPGPAALGRGRRRRLTRREDTAIVGYRDKEESMAFGMLQPEELGPGLVHLPIDEVRTEGPARGRRSASRSPSPTGPPSGFTSTSTSSTRPPFRATDYLMPTA